ncbi:hypothetical protein GCM10027589_54790 [Actinocorallia lasiicapitis]
MDLVTTAKAPEAAARALPIGNPPDEGTLRWVQECLGAGSKVKMIRPLTGGTDHTNHALVVETRSGTPHRFVLRRWTSWDPEFPPEREIAALALLAGCEIPTPQLMAADPSGARCDAPALLITRLPGHPPRPAPDDLSEYLIQLAAALLSIHEVGGASTMPPYTPYNRLDVRQPPRQAQNPGLWEKAFDVVSGPQPEFLPRFIHRDYHPDNTLWAYGRLQGVIDWDKASYGPIGIDIAHMRWNLLLRYGLEAADRFASAFEQVRGAYEHNPYWDVRCVVDLLPEEDDHFLDERRTALLEDYLRELLARMGVLRH